TVAGGRGVGGGVEAFTGLRAGRASRFGFLDTMIITGWDPPRRCEVRHTGRLVRGSGAFEVEPLPDGGSRFTWAEWLEVPLGRLGVVGFLLIRPLLRSSLRAALHRFAGWLPDPAAARGTG